MPEKNPLKHIRVSKKTKQYPRNKIILLTALVVLLTVIITCFVYNLISIFDIKTYDYYITVSEKGEIGLNIDTDALYFGAIPRGNSGGRYIHIVNSHKEPLRIVIKTSGKGSEWIEPQENAFILNSNQNKTVAIIAKIPKATAVGEYSGTLSVFFKKI
ncbi:hypothetical protein KY317_04305 [Candidatus Woesearchaeota archaeon]|nr:hypothetical protein [Candidatus Woesearchaeota archaeon]